MAQNHWPKPRVTSDTAAGLPIDERYSPIPESRLSSGPHRQTQSSHPSGNSPTRLKLRLFISDSIKYAFPDERNGEISVSMKKLDKELELIVMNDGVGMPDGFDLQKADSLGLKLVKIIAEDQLDGSIVMKNKNGTKFTIKFNIET